MEKINIGELLKDCPTGMELDCTICDNVYFDEVTPHMIKCFVKNDVYNTIYFHHDGTYFPAQSAKCVIFPKGKTTWEGFKKPFKDGDVLYIDCNDGEDTYEQHQYIFILKQISEGKIDSYCYVNGTNESKFEICWLATMDDIKHGPRFADEEEKEKLFKAIKDNGYRWNAEIKTLEKLIVPKFKVGDKIANRNSISTSWIVSSVSSEYYGLKLPNGNENIGVLPVSEQDSWELVPIIPIFNVEDKIRRKGDSVLFTITAVDYNHYIMEPINSSNGFNNCKVLEYISFSDQNNFELVPNKFEISTLKPFDKVLVRSGNSHTWKTGFFSHIDKSNNKSFFVVNTHYWSQCIPFEGNEHHVGTTNDCDEYYKNW